MPRPKYHIVVCTNTRQPGHPKGSCGEKGAQEIAKRFSEELEKRNLFGGVMLTGSTCVGMCHVGPVVIVYPDAVWYQGVKAGDVQEIIEGHIIKGKPVGRLMIPESAWG